MNIKEFAEMLNGREYLKEITEKEEVIAKDSNFVVVYGHSDDLVELRGAIEGELDCYNGGEFYLNSNGLPKNECDDPECPYFKKEKEEMKKIEVVWDSDGYSWTYKTTIPHATFEIFETDEENVRVPYCKGIIFSLDGLRWS